MIKMMDQLYANEIFLFKVRKNFFLAYDDGLTDGRTKR